MVLGLGRGRRGLCDVLVVAKERKDLLFYILWLWVLRRGFAKTCWIFKSSMKL